MLLCAEDERPRSHLTATRDSAFLLIFVLPAVYSRDREGVAFPPVGPPVNILIHLRQPPVVQRRSRTMSRLWDLRAPLQHADPFHG